MRRSFKEVHDFKPCYLVCTNRLSTTHQPTHKLSDYYNLLYVLNNTGHLTGGQPVSMETRRRWDLGPSTVVLLYTVSVKSVILALQPFFFLAKFDFWKILTDSRGANKVTNNMYKKINQTKLIKGLFSFNGISWLVRTKIYFKRFWFTLFSITIRFTLFGVLTSAEI